FSFFFYHNEIDIQKTLIYLDPIFNFRLEATNGQGGGVSWKCRKVNSLRRTSRTPENMPFPSGLSVDTAY
ncbi:hypothetical protein J4W09_22240, partial [Escherichia coli]